jgi:hypothetical protein
MKDGDFDRLRIPIDAEPDEEDPLEDAKRLGLASTPGQLAAGSAILAALILVGLAALRRGRRGGSDTDEGA